ncbi:MBL fold metallo-hydrolase [Tenggerimyces flavus]|uniref:MBL fold metallo-hydrolase n=1 Tax=Tenggerimyces flavus TaxID=1708749 RepID=A0ABV7YNL8_9ACTN|nr:MBL fold metallo-hydrolase [Tenggerimyces flavus]MBM7786383.1 ribonuclease BN (tRNA processing enzyme) [Tenggerimyces flavus]
MRLTVIGSSGSFPGPNSAASCYLVESFDPEPYRLVLDLGNGALGPLASCTDIYGIDAVALTHLHPDHCIDLCAYYVARKYHPNGAQPQVPVFAPTGAADRMATAYGLPLKPGMREEFDFQNWVGGEKIRLGPFLVTVAPMAHPVEAYAIRVEQNGRTLVYSGDTGPTTALVDLARGADLLLTEASFLEGDDNPPDVHLTGREAAEHATLAGVRRLVLTHIPPWHDPLRVLADARPAYDHPIELAKPGATYDI